MAQGIEMQQRAFRLEVTHWNLTRVSGNWKLLFSDVHKRGLVSQKNPSLKHWS